MSELTQCNYCALKKIRESARKKGLKVSRRAVDWGLGGFDIFVHPKDVVIVIGNKEQRDKYCVGWMQEIGDHCTC